MKQTCLKQKSTKPTKPKKKSAKSCSAPQNQWHAFMHPDSYLLFPGSNDARQRLCYTLLEWASHPENVEISRFRAEHKIPLSTILWLADTYEDFRLAYNEAKLMMAGNRRHGCIKKTYDNKSAFRDIHLYDKAEDEINKYHAELTKNSAQDKGNVHITVIDSKPEVQSLEDLKKDQDGK